MPFIPYQMHLKQREQLTQHNICMHFFDHLVYMINNIVSETSLYFFSVQAFKSLEDLMESMPEFQVCKYFKNLRTTAFENYLMEIRTVNSHVIITVCEFFRECLI